MAMTTITAIVLLSVLQYTLVAPAPISPVNKKLDDLITEVESVNEKLDTIASLLTNGLETTQYDECYKGMASMNKPPRTFVTIPGNRTARCDTVTDGGGWIVFQRRSDGKEDFFRNWEDYKSGFGDVIGGGDYWLGNEIIHQLTWTRTFELRVDMVHQRQKYFAHYSSFYLGDETTKYTLHIGNYSGDADDNLRYHDNTKFSTYDLDSDTWSGGNCAVVEHGAWWYRQCYLSNLNGAWGATDVTGVNWQDLVKNGLSFTEMKMRLI